MIAIGVVILSVCLFALVCFADAQREDLCNGNGVFEPDAKQCECFDCFRGADCADFGEDCVLDAGQANGEMMAQYWDNQTDPWRIQIPSYYRTSYEPSQIIQDGGNSTSGLTRLARTTLDNLHAVIGNANTTGRALVLGNGATQLIQAFIAALSEKAGKPLWVYTKAPFYPTFKVFAERSKWSLGFTQRTDLNPADVVEIITQPNNPDGRYDTPVYAAASHIYDMVYYWPAGAGKQMTLTDVDISVWSASKSIGHAASRFGWAYVRDPTLLTSLDTYLHFSTHGVGVEAVWRSLNLLQHVTSQSVTDPSSFFGYASAKFKMRWQQLAAVFGTSTSFELVSRPGTWFAWIKCASTIHGTCGELFEKAGIHGNYGAGETGVSGHVRLNLNLRDAKWKLVFKRLVHVISSH
eukprot:TRINITY_DN6886_c0_g1_i1.p1 TRINITY_DN6886_c0_g1~~TRINITY_DN6886_c0_g1_i1.p1  ORF type:complete len:408 (+),score=53.70 TRINITY_DN6886_c0_g1_i1:113-1336(+)